MRAGRLKSLPAPAGRFRRARAGQDARRHILSRSARAAAAAQDSRACGACPIFPPPGQAKRRLSGVGREDCAVCSGPVALYTGICPKGGHANRCSLRAGLAFVGTRPAHSERHGAGRRSESSALCRPRRRVRCALRRLFHAPEGACICSSMGEGRRPAGIPGGAGKAPPCRIAPHTPALPGAGCRQRKARVQRARKLYCAPKCAILY